MYFSSSNLRSIPFWDAVRIVYMSKLLSPPAAPGLRRRLNPNRIFLPRALRDAIPNLPTCIGRDLVIEGLSARVSDNVFMGRYVRLELLAVETGKLTGQFPVKISLSAEAARALAENLTKLAEQAESSAGHA
jgi:hypothetical protein